jgi:hypothetical protein
VPSFTEIFRAQPDDVRQALRTGLGAIVILTTHAVGLNGNQVFIAVVLAAFVTVSMIVTSRRAALTMIAAAGTLAACPMRVAPLTIEDPTAVTDRGLFTAAIPAGQTWQYSFTLTDADDRERECGSFESTIYIDGGQLKDETVNIRLDGAPLLAPPTFLNSNGLDQIRVGTNVTGIRSLSVSIAAKPGATPGIRVAPETDGTTIYTDSVFLELKNPKCTVIYETIRRVLN